MASDTIPVPRKRDRALVYWYDLGRRAVNSAVSVHMSLFVAGAGSKAITRLIPVPPAVLLPPKRHRMGAERLRALSLRPVLLRVNKKNLTWQHGFVLLTV
jgi:hypothetical protein